MMRPKSSMRTSSGLAGAGLLALLIALSGLWIDTAAFCVAWLVAWWTWAGFVLGSQANLWLHDLTGGSWARPVRSRLTHAAHSVGLLSVLLLPVLFTMDSLYPWMASDWRPSSVHPQFQAVWLDSRFVLARVICFLLLWNLLIGRWRRHAVGPAKHEKGGKSHRSRRQRFPAVAAAFGLILYGISASLVAVDLVMSLTPSWYSSGFALVVITAQMKSGLAWGVLRGAKHASPGQRRDLGNLLMMYVLMWAYLAFTQFQIIWAENLPHEIAWYLPRLQGEWVGLAITLVAGGFFVPQVLLLFRAFKENARCLQAVAALLCLMAVLESIWLILPSVNVSALHLAWITPLTLAGMGAILYAYDPGPALRARAARRDKGLNVKIIQ